MTVNSATDALIESYLINLGHELRFVRPELRNDFVKEISTHIAMERDALLEDNTPAVREILSRLGASTVIARGIREIDRNQNHHDKLYRRIPRFIYRYRLRIVTILFTALVIGFQQYVVHYAPLNAIEGGGSGSYVLNANGHLARSSTDSYANFKTWFPSKGDHTVEFIASIDNPGPWGIRIDYVGMDNPTTNTYSESHSYFFSGYPNTGGQFKPIILQSQGYREFLVQLPMKCFPAPTGEWSTFTQFSVEYDFLGAHHWLWIQLPQSFAVVAPTSC
jgi:hypothetical protein